MKLLLCLSPLALFSIISFPVNADPAIQVFQCTVNGQRVFSDHSCGDDAVQRDVMVANTMAPIRTSTEKEAKARHPHASKRIAVDDQWDKRRQQCARTQKLRDALTDKMRAGYTARQEQRLHDRLRKLNDDYFELRCSSVR